MDSFLSCMCIVCIASDANYNNNYNNNYKYNNKNKYKNNINNRNILNDFLRKFSENSHSFPIK